MRSFRFRFETLLRLRRRREDERKTELGVKRAATRERERGRDELRRELRTIPEMRRHLTSRSADPAVLLDCDRYQTALRVAVAAAEKRLDEARREEEEARCRLEEAVRERKILEKLRERLEERHWAEERRLEQAVLDDIGTLSAAHRAQNR